MPRIRSTDFVLQTADVTSQNVVMPQPHVAGDVFFCVAIKDSVTTAGPTTASTGWFQGMATSTSTGGTTTAGGLCSWFVKVATSNDDPDLVITQSDTDSMTVGIVAIKGCGVTKTITTYAWAAGSTTYTSTAHGFQVGNIVDITGMTPTGANGTFAITAVAANTFTVVDADPGAYSAGGSANCIVDAHGGNGTIDSTGAPYGVPGVTTNFAKSMVVYTCFTGGSGCPVHYPGLMGIMAVDTATEGLAMAYKVQNTAGASGTFNFYTNAVNTANLGVAVAFRNSTVGEETAYFDTDWATLIHPFRGSVAIITGDVWGTALTNYPTSGKDNATAVFQVDQSGGPSYVNYTTAASETTNADVIPFPATEAAGAEGTGDWFAIGYTKPFFSLTIDTAGATAGVAGVITWEYWNGTAWFALPSVTDGTTSFTAVAADGLQIRWAAPANFNWTPKVINGSASLYYVRARCTTVYTTNPTLSQIYIGGQSLVFDAVAASTDSGVIEWEDAASITGASNVSQISGTYMDLGQTVNLAGTIICGTYMYALPRDWVDSCQFKEGGGIHVMFGDTSFNRRHWCVGSFKDSQSKSDQRNRFAIDWAQTTNTEMSRTATAPSDTIADVFIGNKANRGAGSVFFSHMIAVNPTNTVVNGGSTAYPITSEEFLKMGDASPVQLFRGNELLIPITFGGTDYINLGLDGFTYSFPEIATPWSDPYNERPCSMAHYDSGRLGFILDARAGDSCKMTNGKITSRSPWQFTLTATASASATWDFSGMLFENANVTLRPVFTYDNIKWQSCPSFVTNGSTMTNQTFVNTKVTVSSPANAALISSSSFTKTTGTQHGLEINGNVAHITLTGLTFTGYASSNGSTGNEAIYVNMLPERVQRGSVLEAGDKASTDFFGTSVSLSESGTVLAVGAEQWEGAAGTNRGGVYIYDWSGSVWTQRGSVLEAADAADSDSFGSSVALSSDGVILAVGAYNWEGTGTNRGGVYIYDWSGSAWTPRGSVLEAADAADVDWFGWSVALSSDGGILVVGAYQWENGTPNGRGGVYIYDWSGSAWVQRGSVLEAADAADSDSFGSSVALSSDGSILAVGARNWEGAAGTDRGGVYIYDWSGSAWTPRGSVLEAADAADSDYFGYSVALSKDGNVLVVGAIEWEPSGTARYGGVYIYDWISSTWTQRGTVLEAGDQVSVDFFGSSVALGSSGTILIVGADGRNAVDYGGVYTYDINGQVMTITITDGTTPSIRTAGTVVTVLAGLVNATLTVKDTSVPPVAISGASVNVVAAAGGPLPYDVTVTITNSGTTATVSHTAHGMATGDKVQIKKASLTANNGVFIITKIDANSYSYTMGSTPGSNPTGTIKATYVLLNGTTDGSGVITMTRVFSSTQPITGRVRKSSAPPYYKTNDFVGSVSTTTGFASTIQLALDQ